MRSLKRHRSARTLAAGHAFVVLGFGNSCGSNAAPYIVHCSVKSLGPGSSDFLVASRFRYR